MRIAFDATTLQPGRTGVGYYSEHLLRHLAGASSAPEIVALSNQRLDVTDPLPPEVRVRVVPSRLPRAVWLQTVVPGELRRAQVDVAHFTNGMIPLLSPVPTVVTIHDTSLTTFPRFHPLRRRIINRPLMSAAARRADAIITVSESARHDIVRTYGVDEQRVHVVHEAAAPGFRPSNDVAALDAVRRRYELADRFILYVGAIEPRKNLPALLEGFARHRRRGALPHQLVCAGPYGWLSAHLDRTIDELGIRDAVKFLGYVPFADLPALYNLAEFFVFPSVYEGFGLPVVEAMACGTPVLTGQVAALQEVGGEAIEQVGSLDADALGEAMMRLAARGERRRELRERGLARSARFSWTRAARETLRVYERVRHAAVVPSGAPSRVRQ